MKQKEKIEEVNEAVGAEMEEKWTLKPLFKLTNN